MRYFHNHEGTPAVEYLTWELVPCVALQLVVNTIRTDKVLHSMNWTVQSPELPIRNKQRLWQTKIKRGQIEPVEGTHLIYPFFKEHRKETRKLFKSGRSKAQLYRSQQNLCVYSTIAIKNSKSIELRLSRVHRNTKKTMNALNSLISLKSISNLKKFAFDM